MKKKNLMLIVERPRKIRLIENQGLIAGTPFPLPTGSRRQRREREEQSASDLGNHDATPPNPNYRGERRD